MKTSIMAQIHYETKTGVLSTQIAILSFTLGTIIMLFTQAFPKAEGLYVLGLFYVVTAFLVNTAMFLMLLYFFILETGQREYFAVKMLIMLANIPVVALYIFLLVNPIF